MDYIEYKTLTLTHDMLLSWYKDIFKKKIIKFKKPRNDMWRSLFITVNFGIVAQTTIPFVQITIFSLLELLLLK